MKIRLLSAVSGLAALSAIACSPSTEAGPTTGAPGGTQDGTGTPGGQITDPLAGGGTGTPTGGTGTPSAAAGVTLGANSGACGVLPVTFRDFLGAGEQPVTTAEGQVVNPHADFEISARYPAGAGWDGKDPSVSGARYGNPPGSQPYMGVNEAGCNLVADALGADGKPVFQHGLGFARTLEPMTYTPGIPQTITGCRPDLNWPWDWTPPNVIVDATTFNLWYNDDPNYNMTILGDITLTEANGVSSFESAAFFPLDGAGLGNTPGQTHNYHFTTESHVSFTYTPGTGQKFSFVGDDDLWIFVNGILAMDLGGVHEPLSGEIDFDAQAADLGITAGGEFSMDIFHAERQTDQSNFKVTVTNIDCFVPTVR